MIIADDIMVIGYQEDEQDHDKTFTTVIGHCQEEQHKIKFQ